MCQLCFLFPLHTNLYLLSAYIKEGKESLVSKSSLLLQNAKGIESDIHQGFLGVWLVGWSWFVLNPPYNEQYFWKN